MDPEPQTHIPKVHEMPRRPAKPREDPGRVRQGQRRDFLRRGTRFLGTLLCFIDTLFCFLDTLFYVLDTLFCFLYTLFCFKVTLMCLPDTLSLLRPRHTTVLPWLSEQIQDGFVKVNVKIFFRSGNRPLPSARA